MKGLEQLAAREWASRPADQRFETLDALHAAVLLRQSRSLEDVSRVENMSVLAVGDNELAIDNGDGIWTTPTNWSFGQLCQQIGAPSGYLRKLPAKLTAENMNYGIEQVKDREAKVMTLYNPEGEYRTLQAVTSKTYGRIWDRQVVEAVQDVVGRSEGSFYNPKDWNGRPSGLYASDRDVFMFLIDGGSILDAGMTWDHKPDVLHRGFFVWNSEVGSKTLGIAMFLFRIVCGNHIVWDAQEVKTLKIRHSLYAPERFASEVYPTLKAHMDATAKPVEQAIVKAKQYMLPAETAKFDEWAFGRGFTKTEHKLAVETATREEGDCRTLYQYVNGLTSAAKHFAHVDTRLDLERRAGKLFELVA